MRCFISLSFATLTTSASLGPDPYTLQRARTRLLAQAIIKKIHETNIPELFFKSENEGEERIRGGDGKILIFQMTNESFKYSTDVIVTTARKCEEKSVLLFALPNCESAPNYVLKFVNNCESVFRCSSGVKNSCGFAETDPLAHEFVFSKLINDQLGPAVTPKIIGMSVEFVPNWNSKHLSVVEAQRKKLFSDGIGKGINCSASHARVGIQEKVGLSLASIDFRSAKIDSDSKRMKIVTKIFISSLHLLAKIHSIGIVHGDIHRGNIAFGKIFDNTKLNQELNKLGFTDYSELPELVLIDFGKAVIDTKVPVKTTPPNLGDKKSLTILSPDQLISLAPRPRDDIRRLFEIFIDIITEGKLTALFTKAVIQNEPVRNLKLLKEKFDFIRGNLSELEPDLDSLDASLVAKMRDYGPISDREEILSKFSEIQNLVRSENPSETQIIELAQEILKQL